MADPKRRRILQTVASRPETSVSALSKPFRISPPAISRHLRVLEKARLIERRRHGREHLIRARPAGLNDAQQWMANCVAGWQFSFDALDNLLKKEYVTVPDTLLRNTRELQKYFDASYRYVQGLKPKATTRKK